MFNKIRVFVKDHLVSLVSGTYIPTPEFEQAIHVGQVEDTDLDEIKDLLFSCYSVALSDDESKSTMSKIKDGGYLDEISDRLSTLNVKLHTYINVSQIYSEVISGYKNRIVFVGYSKDKNIDRQDIEYIFQDIIDDFSQLGLLLRFSTIILGITQNELVT